MALLTHNRACVLTIATVLHMAQGVFRQCTNDDFSPDMSDRDHRVVPNMTIAVFTFNIGGYDPAPDTVTIPRVPQGMKAYYVTDGNWDTLDTVTRAVVHTWAEAGWKPVLVEPESATDTISAGRLTSKRVKFSPPAELEKDADWLVVHDANMHIDLEALPSFLDSYSYSPLLMLDWRHWPNNYSMSGFEAMKVEMGSMLTGFLSDHLTTELGRTICTEWLEMTTTLRSKVDTDDDLFPHYYDSSIFFRNLRHRKAPDVKAALQQIFDQCRYIERDQFLVPLTMAEKNLTTDIVPVRQTDLSDRLGHCKILDHAKMFGS